MASARIFLQRTGTVLVHGYGSVRQKYVKIVLGFLFDGRLFLSRSLRHHYFYMYIALVMLYVAFVISWPFCDRQFCEIVACIKAVCAAVVFMISQPREVVTSVRL
jgi:hypothetical protein